MSTIGIIVIIDIEVPLLLYFDKEFKGVIT
jgi:hypothetical protein